MTITTTQSQLIELTHEERLTKEQELTDALLYRQCGIDFIYINEHQFWRIGIFTPWDLFTWCDSHNIYLKIQIETYYSLTNRRDYSYHGIKLKQTIITTIEGEQS
jgi:hypothetical protein